MKVQVRNLTYRKATAKCFICSASRLDFDIGRLNWILLRCVDTSEKCNFSNLYNNNIFKL